MNDDDDSFEYLLACAEAEAVDLVQLDEKLSNDFRKWNKKREFNELNFRSLKRLAWLLHRYKYKVDAVGMGCNMEHDIVTLMDAVEKAVRAKPAEDQTSMEELFLSTVDTYRRGVREMEAYQEGMREFLTLARIKYDNGMDRDVYTFERYLARFSCMKICHVAEHGVIIKTYQLNRSNM